MRLMGDYRQKRYVFFGVMSALLLIFPFIQIDGNQLFLLSFERKQLHLVGIVFDIQEFYLMPFLLILLFVGICFVTTLAGRVWCGWACPQTIFRVLYRDFLQTKLLGLRRKIDNKQERMKLDTLMAKLKAVLAFLILFVLCLMAAANLMFFFTPPADFFAYMREPFEHTILLGFWLGFGLVFVFEVAFVGENFCVYMCPYCRIQSVLYDDETIMPVYDSKRGGEVYDAKGMKFSLAPQKLNPANECIACAQCVKVCPAHIDIRKGLQLECINCLECVDACGKIMGKFGKSSLVQWKSSASMLRDGKARFMRFKIIGYVLVLLSVIVLLFVMGSSKESMLLNINRTTELYELKPHGIVENNYTMLFQNTDSVDHMMYFEILDSKKGGGMAESFRIISPKGPFLVRAGQKSKQIVRIRVQGRDLLQNRTSGGFKQGSYDLVIRAFALEDKERIFVERKTKFIYPDLESLKD